MRNYNKTFSSYGHEKYVSHSTPMNAVHYWKKFGINLTKYRNTYRGIMFHIKFLVIFSEDLDIFKCFLMKQNFGKFHYQNISLRTSLFNIFPSNFQDMEYFELPSPIFFQACINIFSPNCIKKSVNISAYLARHLSFGKFKYNPKHWPLPAAADCMTTLNQKGSKSWGNN